MWNIDNYSFQRAHQIEAFFYCSSLQYFIYSFICSLTVKDFLNVCKCPKVGLTAMNNKGTPVLKH